MAYEEKPDSGVLFPNSRKQKDTHPDYTGRGNYGGVEFEISAWKRVSPSGQPRLSIAFKKPYVKPSRPADDIGDNWW